MNTYYKYKDKKIVQFLSNSLLIRTELEKVGITFLVSDFMDIEQFTQQIKDKYGFTGHDEFKIWNEFVRKNVHHHSSPESRMLLVGSGKYYIQLEDYTIELSVNPGTFIIIPINLKHYFNTDEQTIFLRFFSDNGSTELDDLTGEIK